MSIIKTVTVQVSVEDLRISDPLSNVTSERVRVNISVSTERFDHQRVRTVYACDMALNDVESRFERYAGAALREHKEALKTLPQEADEFWTLSGEVLDIRRKGNNG